MSKLSKKQISKIIEEERMKELSRIHREINDRFITARYVDSDIKYVGLLESMDTGIKVHKLTKEGNSE